MRTNKDSGGIEEFEPTEECLSDCFDNEQHSVFCQHYKGIEE